MRHNNNDNAADDDWAMNNDIDLISELDLPCCDLDFNNSEPFTITTVNSIMEHVKQPWTGSLFGEKNFECVDIGIFNQHYLESLWRQFFTSLTPNSMYLN